MGPLLPSSILFATATSFGALVGAQNTTGQHSPYVPRQASSYGVQDWYNGWAFFSEWNFFNDPDPTGGNVNYLDMADAQNAGLAYVDSNGRLVLAVDSTSDVPAGGNRNSVRIQSNNAYTGGLFIIDAAAMPAGCGVWPSFWSNGPNWPYGGEIDIIEGVDNQQDDQMTLHSGTSNPCTQSGAFTGQLLNPNCYSTQTADAGCSIHVSDSSSFGYGFNNAGGGVYALLWDSSVGMSIWFFSRNNIPWDISNASPTPQNWGTPAGFWSVQTCDISDNFYDHTLIIDTTICGGWAGSAYGNPGCPGTCSNIVADASNFADAQWVINYVAVYQPQ